MQDEELCNALAAQLADEHNAVVARAAATATIASQVPPTHPELRDRLAELFLALRRRGATLGAIMHVHGHLVAAAAAATSDRWPTVRASLERQFFPPGT